LLARNHPLVDGGEPSAWAAAWTFPYLNGGELRSDFDVDDAEIVMNDVVTTNDLTVDYIAGRLSTYAL
jgi:death on curing protein